MIVKFILAFRANEVELAAQDDAGTLEWRMGREIEVASIFSITAHDFLNRGVDKKLADDLALAIREALHNRWPDDAFVVRPMRYRNPRWGPPIPIGELEDF